MGIYYPENLFNLLKNKHLLLDTNVFIDSFNFGNPADYTKFLNDLKDNDTTLTTIDGVILEFLKGSKNDAVYKQKKEHLEDIIDVKLPAHKDDNTNIAELIKLSGADGGNVAIVDYYLGANLLKYKNNLFLMSRNVKDFPQNIFSLVSTVSVASARTIFTYGIYTYTKQQKIKINPDDIPF